MHGQNKLRPAERNPNGNLQVREVWYTIQGEGPFYGVPAVFVRLTGCNLACDFCDTVWDDEKDPYITVNDIIARIRAVGSGKVEREDCKLVVLTGGEPARQDLTMLLQYLGELGYHVQIETAGTYWQKCFLQNHVTIVCSPKTKFVHPKIKEYCLHWKYVIQAGKVNIYDGMPAGSTQFVPLEAVKGYIAPDIYQSSDDSVRKGFLSMVTASAKYGTPARPPCKPGTLLPSDAVTVWLSPCDEGDAAATDRNVKLVGKLCMKYGYRAQVQLHKYMDLP